MERREEVATIPAINVPPNTPPTPDELSARQEVIDRILDRRERIGLAGVSLNDLIRQVREDAL